MLLLHLYSQHSYYISTFIPSIPYSLPNISSTSDKWPIIYRTRITLNIPYFNLFHTLPNYPTVLYVAIPSPPFPVFYSSLYYIPHSTLSSLMPLHPSSLFPLYLHHAHTLFLHYSFSRCTFHSILLFSPFLYYPLFSSCFHLVSSCSLSVPAFSLISLLSSFYHPSSSTFLFPSLSSFFASSQNEKDPGLTLLLSRVFSKKGGGFLLSHIALQYHRRKRA